IAGDQGPCPLPLSRVNPQPARILTADPVDEFPVALDSIRRRIGGEDPVQQLDLLIDFSEMK
ncbi:hypothetical protein KI387_002671, partial [Taxus chinensis]